MAPLFHLFLALFLASSAIASPHLSPNHYSHARRAVVARHPVADPDTGSLVIPKRKRSLNKRCIPRPSNSTSTSASTTSTPTPTSTTPTSTPTPSSYSTPLNVAPAPSPAPSSSTPSPSPTPTPSSTAPPAQTTGNSNGEPSYLIGPQTGQGTWYETGLGACGVTNNNNDHICAVSHFLFDSFPEYSGGDPNRNPVCGRQILITTSGASVTVNVTDRCEACQTTDLDLAPSAFQILAPLGTGRIPITWNWI